MAAGELISSQERLVLDKAIRRAEQTSRFEFSVYVGSVEGDDPRTFAARLHQRLVAPDRSVLLLVDPRGRRTEVVTGAEVRRHLTDREVELALVAMQSDFASGELCSGLVRGIDMLAEHARPQVTLHAGA